MQLDIARAVADYKTSERMRAMVKVVIAVLSCALLSPSAWAISQGPSCRSGVRVHGYAVQLALVCGPYLDPWQDCSEDPWQPSSSASVSSRESEAFEDPWQVPSKPAAKVSSVAATLNSSEDPWQPAFADPWQDAESGGDPWQ